MFSVGTELRTPDESIGEVTPSPPYTVTPGTDDYEVTFEITPAPETSGEVFDSLSLSFEQVGGAAVHGAYRQTRRRS